jgi:hypothetical protein
VRADFSTQRRRRGARPVELLLLVLSGGALVWSGSAAMTASRDLESVSRSVRLLKERAQQSQQRVQQIDSRRHGRDDDLARQARQTLKAPPSRVLADLAETMPGAARLEALTLAYGGDAVLLDVRLLTHTPAAYDEFVSRLARSQRFEGLSFGDEKRKPEMKVSLRARYREAEAP